MDDIIKAMRVLAEELLEETENQVGVAYQVIDANRRVLSKAADRLERESKNPGAEEM